MRRINRRIPVRCSNNSVMLACVVVKRLYVTLLELLLVLAIIAIVGSFVALNIKDVLYEQRFRSEVDRVVNQLRLAQDLMLIFDGDVHFRLASAKDNKSFEYGLVFDHAMPNRWSTQLQKMSHLTAIHNVYFPIDPQDRSEGLDIKFLSGGAVMSKGVFRLSSAAHDGPGVLTRYICLTGHPAPIFSTATPLKEEECVSKETAFDTQLTQRTGDEIHVLNP